MLEKEEFGEYELHRFTDAKTGESFAVIPAFGAMLQELKLRKGKQLYDVIEGCKDASQLPDNHGYKSSHLAPFPNRVEKGLYRFNEQTYRLTPNYVEEDNAIHGLIFDKKFDLELKQNGETSCLKLQCDFEGTPGFPFPFLTTIEYHLQDGQFQCNVLMHNSGEQDMPAGIGWHPYFKLGDKKINQLALKLPEGKKIQTNKMIPTGKFVDYQQFRTAAPIGQTPFDTGFYINNDGQEAITTLTDEEQNVTLLISQKNCPYLQVFIPPARDCIAIEPMTCASDAFNNGMGLETLKPGEHVAAFYSVMLK